MRLLVTGGLGFIGSHVVRAALADGDDVVVLDRVDPQTVGAAVLSRVEGARILTGEVGNPDVVARAAAGVDVVLHQAARVGLGRGTADAAQYVHDNDLATAVLLATIGDSVARVVVASSMVVYGPGVGRCLDHGVVVPAPRTPEALADGEFDAPCPTCGAPLAVTPVDEHVAHRPANVYAATKCAQEHLVVAWARANQTDARMLRYHNVFGPGLPADTPYAGVAALFLSALDRGQAPRVFEDGEQLRDFVHVRDVARANLVAARLPATPGDAVPYNVASGKPRSVGELARALSAVRDGPSPVVTGEFRLGDVRHITASNDRLVAAGWSPREDFLAAVEELGAVRAL